MVCRSGAAGARERDGVACDMAQGRVCSERVVFASKCVVGGSGILLRRFGAVVRCSETGRAGNADDVACDVADDGGGSGRGAVGLGASWGELDGVDRLLDRFRGRWGGDSVYVAFATSFGEFSAVFNDSGASSSTAFVSTGMDCWGALATAWLAVFEVSAADWVFAVAQIVILAVVGAVVVAIVDCDVAGNGGGSGHETEGWGVCCGQPGGVEHLLDLCREG